MKEVLLTTHKQNMAAWEVRNEVWLKEEAEKNAKYYFVAGTLRKRTMYEDVEVFNEQEWIQVSALIDVLECFKK